MCRAQRSPLLVPSFVLSLLLIAGPHVARSEEAKPTEKPAPTAAVDLPEGRTISADTDLEKRIRAALDEPVEMQYLDTQLGDVARDLSLRYKIPVEYDYASLNAAGLNVDGKGDITLFSFQRREGSLRSALRLLLATAGLTFVVRNDTLLFTTKTAAEAMTSTRIYQVHDLVVMPNDPTAAHPDFDTLVELITTTILPESWRAAGGSAGEIKSFRGPGVLALVVTHTDAAHEQVESLLKTLRAAREPKVQDLQRQAKPAEDKDAAAKKARSTGGSGGGFF
ncbi:MAG: hypothetical protein C0483_21190 [Pirellula sp.]|nr:hypothetical protein [Pirellula sp.]